MIKLLDSQKVNIAILLIIASILVIGNMYLFSLMNKIKLMSEEGELEKKIRQVNSEISKLKIEIDEKIDLDRIEKTARKQLKMEMTDKVNYIKYE